MLTNNELKLFEPWVISVAKTGSSALPWIKDPYDTDYVFYVTNRRDTARLIKLFKLKPIDECWIVGELSTNKCARLYAYEYHYLQPLFGTEFPDYDIFEHINEYKQILINHGLGQPLVVKHKFWYHVLTGIYMLDNGRYELTEEQIKNVNLCHDRQMTEELYNYIQERLAQYKAELDYLDDVTSKL